MDKTLSRFLVTSGGLVSNKKCDELSESVALGQKLRYFTDQLEPKGGPHENEFWVLSNSEKKLQTVRSKKVDKKMGSFV